MPKSRMILSINFFPAMASWLAKEQFSLNLNETAGFKE